MIGKIIARLSMSEDRQIPAIERKKLGNVSENVSRNGQLNAAARVWTNGAKVEVADSDREARLHRSGKLPCPLDLLTVVIDVGVEVADVRFSHVTAYSA